MMRICGVASELTPATPVSDEGGQAMPGRRHTRRGLAGGCSWMKLAGGDDSACCQDPRVLHWTESGRDLALRTEAAGARASPGHGVGIARGVASRLGRVVSCLGLGDWRAFGPARQGDSIRGQANRQFFRRRQRAWQKDEVYHVLGSAGNAKTREARPPAPLPPSISCRGRCGPSSASACTATGW